MWSAFSMKSHKILHIMLQLPTQTAAIFRLL